MSLLSFYKLIYMDISIHLIPVRFFMQKVGTILVSLMDDTVLTNENARDHHESITVLHLNLINFYRLVHK